MDTADPIRVYFPRPPEELHFVYQEAYENPPDGVEYVVDDPDADDSAFATVVDTVRSTLVSASSVSRTLYKRFWRWGDVSKIGVRTPEYDLYHSRSATRRRNEPWIQECEHVGTLLGRHFRKHFDDETEVGRVGDALADDACRAITPHTKAAAESIRLTIPDSHRFEDKLEHVYLAYDPPDETHPPTDEGDVHFLFVGSSYFSNQFFVKGGDKVLRAFDRIGDDVDARLTVRSDVPDEFVERYGNRDDVDLVTDVVSRERLEEIYRDAEVFVFPSAQGTPGAVFREAMGHTLSIIGLDIWGNDELVEDGETGFLVEPDENFQYLYPEYNVPVVGAGTYFENHGERSLEDVVADLRRDDEALVDRIAEKMRLLAEDDDLRREQALAGRERITTGDLSLRARNEKLGRIYRDAVAR